MTNSIGGIGMNQNTNLQTLLDTGTDAFTNLWSMTISLSDGKDYTARVTSSTLPHPERKTLDIPYMNTKVPVKTPFFDLDKRLTFSIRIDRDYFVYKWLMDNINSDSYEALDMPESSYPKFDVTFMAENTNGKGLVSHTYKNCSVVSVGKNLQYSYDSAKALVVPVTLIYEYKDPKFTNNPYNDLNVRNNGR